jgi:hypothetical protein
VSAWATIIAALILVIGGAVVYRWQKNIDQQIALIELRREAYRRYLTAFSNMTNNTHERNHVSSKKIAQELHLCEFDLLVVGSDEVLKSMNSLKEFYISTNDDRFNRDATKTDELVGKVCQAMRKDCFEKSSLTSEEFQRLVGFK